jgi:acyl-CoA thioesterase-1
MRISLTLLLSILAAAHVTAAAFADVAPVTLVFLADSNLNGAGGRSVIQRSEEFRPILNAALAADGVAVNVVSPGWKEFSEDGVTWLKRDPAAAEMLANPQGYAVMVELGSNDCHDYSLEETHANLNLILSRLHESHIPVLLVGTSAYEICKFAGGPKYLSEYAKVFADLATSYGDLYYPDFKDGVNGHPEFLQPDGDHANGSGNALIAQRMLPVVKELIALVQQP